MKYFSGHFASNHETPAKHQKSSQPQTAKLTTLKINSAGSSGDFEGLKFSLSYRSWICMGTRESKCSLCPLGRENQEAGNKMVCGHIPFVLQLLTAVKLHFLSTELSHQNISHFEFDPSRKKCPLIKKKKMWFEGERKSNMKHIAEGNLRCHLSSWCSSDCRYREDWLLWYLCRPAQRYRAIRSTELHQPLHRFSAWEIHCGHLFAGMCSHFPCFTLCLGLCFTRWSGQYCFHM